MISGSAGMHVMLAGAQAAVCLCVRHVLASLAAWRRFFTRLRCCGWFPRCAFFLRVRSASFCVCGFCIGGAWLWGQSWVCPWTCRRVVRVCALLVERAKPCKAVCRCSCRVADKLRLDHKWVNVICNSSMPLLGQVDKLRLNHTCIGEISFGNFCAV